MEGQALDQEAVTFVSRKESQSRVTFLHNPPPAHLGVTYHPSLRILGPQVALGSFLRICQNERSTVWKHDVAQVFITEGRFFGLENNLSVLIIGSSVLSLLRRSSYPETLRRLVDGSFRLWTPPAFCSLMLRSLRQYYYQCRTSLLRTPVLPTVDYRRTPWVASQHGTGSPEDSQVVGSKAVAKRKLITGGDVSITSKHGRKALVQPRNHRWFQKPVRSTRICVSTSACS